MAHDVPRGLAHHIRDLTGLWRADPRSDRELLDAFTAGDGGAFAAIVVRHGQLVWATCRRVLGNDADSEDAFQATFIALARMASHVRLESLAGWLQTVSCRVALNARKTIRRRIAAQRRLFERASPRVDAPPPDEELRALVADELARLPERLRVPLALYYLDGKAQAEIGQLLSVTDRAVAHRLKQGLKLLRARLARRGLVVSASVLAAVLAKVPVAVALPARLVTSTTRAVLELGGGGTADTPAARLAHEATRVTAWTRSKVVALLLLSTAGLLGGGIILAQRSGTAAPQEPPTPPRAAAPVAVLKTDRFGDPLPPGAVVRFGTVRFRAGNLHGSSSLAFGPAGKALISSHGDESLIFWDPETGREVRRLDGPAACCSVSATPDGTRLVAIGDREVWAWDLSGAAPKSVWKSSSAFAHPGSAEFSPDGRLIACGGEAGEEFRLLDADRGTVARTISARGCRFAFSPDSKLLASWTFSLPGEVHVWEVGTGKQRHTLIAGGEKDTVNSVAFSRDGKVIATVGADRILRVWDGEKGTESRRLANDTDPISFVVFLGDGTLLEIGGGRGRYWDVTTGRVAKKPNPVMGSGWSTAYRLSPDGARVAGAWGLGVGVWDAATGRELGPAAGMPDSFIHPVAFSRDGATLATASFSEAKGASVQEWDAADGKLRRQFRLGHRETVWDLNFAADGALSASVGPFTELPPSPPDRIGRWDARAGGAQQLLQLPKGTRAVAFAPDGQVLAVALPEGIVLHDRATGREVQKLPGKCAAECLAFSADGKSLAASDAGAARVTVWSLPDGRERLRWTPRADRETQPNFRLPVALSPDGRLLAVGFHEPNVGVRIVDVAAGTELAWLGGQQSGWMFREFAFSPDGRTLAGAGEDGGVRVWEVVSWRERYRFPGHRGGVLSVAFSPDGRRLASCSTDTTALIWDVATPQKPAPAERATARQLWTALTGTDAATAHRAIVSLAEDPRIAVPLLKERLRPTPATAEQLRKWLDDLGSEQFAVREAAVEELARRGDGVGKELRRARESATSPEVRARLDRLVAGLRPDSPANRAITRGVEALELMPRDPAARQLLKELANSPAHTVAGREARAALSRLGDATLPGK